MKRKSVYIFLVFIVISISYGLYYFSNRESAIILDSVLSQNLDISGFSRADKISPFDFPIDFGPHNDFQTEWWYYTGNLQDDAGNHYGFQLTFFRRALLPDSMRFERKSNWATEQIYFAHFALTDVAGNEFYSFERFSRDGVDLAGASAIPYHIWLENWDVSETENGDYQLYAAAKNLELFLILKDIKGPIVQGVNGYSQKGPEPGNASYYYSQSRLQANGYIRINDEEIAVTGLSWKDHEYSTSALSEGQIGWDWFSMQLDNDIEIMLFYLRRADGSIDPFSSGTIIFPDGRTQILSQDEFDIVVLDTWTSPNTGAVYPSEWKIDIPSIDMSLKIQPHLANQELLVSFIYWEGAVIIAGNMNGEPVMGNGYIELTGYFQSMEGEF